MKCNTGLHSFDCLLCALFDKSVIVFVFFNVFYLISLENRAELICSPAVSLSLNYAEAKDCFSLSAALFLRIISGLYSPSVGVAELYSTRGESTLRKSSVPVQSQTSAEPFRETCVVLLCRRYTVNPEDTFVVPFFGGNGT